MIQHGCALRSLTISYSVITYDTNIYIRDYYFHEKMIAFPDIIMPHRYCPDGLIFAVKTEDVLPESPQKANHVRKWGNLLNRGCKQTWLAANSITT